MIGWPSVAASRPLIAPVIGGDVTSFVPDFWTGGVDSGAGGFAGVSVWAMVGRTSHVRSIITTSVIGGKTRAGRCNAEKQGFTVDPLSLR